MGDCEERPYENSWIKKDSVMVQTIPQRYYYLDYMRGCLLLILAIDHSGHAYAQTWGRLHFLEDFDRSVVFDVVYMFSNSMVMPGLFFLAGLFTTISLEKHGVVGFFKRRFIRLGLPFILGIPLLGPLLVYPSNVLVEGLHYSLGEYITHYYFNNDLSVSGPFWVLYAIFLYAGIAALLYSLVPPFRSLLRWGGATIIRFPLRSAICIIILSAFILTLSDYYWSAIYWIKLWWIFGIQGGRFLFLILYFFIGLMLGTQLENFQKNLVENYRRYWAVAVMVMVVLGIFYIGYSLIYVDDGAYNSEIRRFLKTEGNLLDAWPLIQEYGGAIAIRTSLHACFCFFQIASLLLIFSHKTDSEPTFWSSWSTYAYLVFLFHELPVLWLQYGMLGMDIPILVKVSINFCLGVLGTWGVLKIVVKETKIQRKTVFS